MKRFTALFLLLTLSLSLFPSYAASLSSGDLMIVQNTARAPLYASYNTWDSTVITYIPSGKTVMYIAAVDRGYCIAYENFVGYVDEYYLKKVNSYFYDFPLPSGDLFRDVTGETSSPAPTVKPGSSSSVRTFPYSAVRIYPNQSISTRTGPGTKYTEPGTFSKNISYVVYYQTQGNSVNWGYVEFMQNGEKIRAYTGVKRFSYAGYLPYDDEPYTTKNVYPSTAVHYGPGYDYMTSPYDPPFSGMSVKAFFTENGWTMIEYELSNGYINRGWIPSSCLY